MATKKATFNAGNNLKRLGSKKRAEGEQVEGDFVHESQDMGTKESFKNVSKLWLDKTMTFNEGLTALDKEKSQTEDILATVDEMTPGVNTKGQCVIKYADGREFRPTAFAVGHLGERGGCGKWFAAKMMGLQSDTPFVPDKEDAETLAHVLRNGFRRLRNGNKYLWRTRNDGTLRALLSDQYAIVNNQWFLEVLQELIPDGRLSHWKGDGDTVYGNVLIPDTIRAEADSEYGGMLSIGNSEIGERKVYTCPSVFRAICMNGCIWGAEVGKSIKQVHRGQIDLDELKQVIKLNLETQIPLLPRGIDQMLSTREFVWQGDIHPLLAQVCRDNGLGRSEAQQVMQGYHAERVVAGDMARSLFGVIASLTRAGQKMPPAKWVKMDEIAGIFSSFTMKDWDRLVTRAKSLSPKQVEETFHAQAS